MIKFLLLALLSTIFLYFLIICVVPVFHVHVHVHVFRYSYSHGFHDFVLLLGFGVWLIVPGW